MSEAIKKPIESNPESYSPRTPKLASMMDELYTEKIIDTFVIEGVEFVVIEKANTIYAGVYGAIPELDWKPSSQWWGALDDGYDKEILKAIKDSITPDREIILHIDYATDKRPSAMLCGQESTSREQPEGIHVIEAEPSLFIRVKHSHDVFTLTKKLTGKYVHQYHLLDLHDLIKQIFCAGGQYEFEYNGSRQNGNEDMQINYDSGERYAAVPVRRRR